MNYYNENDPKAAKWLQCLIDENLIPKGHIDERSITEIKKIDLKGFKQCHFFAGIGGWPLALQLADWPKDRQVWTGSCPCQPFSAAGKGLGEKDERHLWPQFFRLIAECAPSTVFGEQVASKAGREWLNGIRIDLETLDYAVGCADLCAASVGASHIRQRLWWVANATGNGRKQRRPKSNRRGIISGIGSGGMGDSNGAQDNPTKSGQCVSGERCNNIVRRGRAIHGVKEICATQFWDAFEIVPCRDGKSRRIEPGTFPLAHGVSGRVGLLRGYGNAIVPQIASEFIKAVSEII